MLNTTKIHPGPDMSKNNKLFARNWTLSKDQFFVKIKRRKDSAPCPKQFERKKG